MQIFLKIKYYNNKIKFRINKIKKIYKITIKKR